MGIAETLFGIEPHIKKTRDDAENVGYTNAPSSFGRSDVKMFPDEVFVKVDGENDNSSGAGKLMKTLAENINTNTVKQYAPDINGYIAISITMPPFKGLSIDSDYKDNVAKNFPFYAIDFTPPQIQVESERVTSRNGGMPYATEVFPSEQITITFIDDINLSVYNFHLQWIDYIHQLLDGTTEAPSEYLDYENDNSYGTLDYAATFWIQKSDPGMTTVKYRAACFGVYPLGLPNKELIGQRAANELTTFSITYACTYFQEATDESHHIFKQAL